MFSKKYDDKVVPEDGTVLKNVNVKDFNSISTEDGLVTIDATTIIYKKDVGLSEMNLRLSFDRDLDELPIKIIFDLKGKEIVIVDYLQGITKDEPVSLFKQNENDLSMADNWRVEVTTKEDLAENYGFEF